MLEIDKEFRTLIPALSPEEFKQLEENCLKEGIRDSLIVWDCDGDRILVDGHNRYEIAQKHNLPYNQMRMEFKDRDEAKAWILRNQLGRRNINNFVRSELVLKLKPMIAEKAKERQREAGGALPQKSAEPKPIETRKELARLAHVSHDTIHKVEVIEEKADEDTKQALRNGDLSINRAYNDIQRLTNEIKAKDKRIAELENRAPEVEIREIEVVPEDYENLRQRADAAERDARIRQEDFSRVREQNREYAERIQALERQIGADQKKRTVSFTINDFTEATRAYISRYGGHVWVFSEIEDVDEGTRTDFIESIKTLNAFTQQLITNLGGGMQ